MLCLFVMAGAAGCRTGNHRGTALDVAGGALGVYLPGHLYRHFGWWVYVTLLVGMLGVSLLLAWRVQPADEPGTSRR